MPNLAEVKKILERPVNKQRLSRAIKHEKRLRFHNKPTIEKPEHQEKFLEWVKTLIPLDKYKTFTKLLGYPVDTVKVTSEAFGALKKVFEAKNPVSNYTFQNDDLKSDWSDYAEGKRFSQWWEETGFETVKYRVNSFLVVDLPREQSTERPEPYMYVLDLSKVIDFKLKGDKLEWIIFRISSTEIAVYDEEAYRVFTTEENTDVPLAELVESFHGLGQCPVTFFWSDAVDEKDPTLKLSPITAQLTELDWMLFFSVSKKYNDMYSSYPVYWGYESSCEYSYDTDNSHYECASGFLVNENNIQLLTPEGDPMKCPKCSNSLSGVGAMVEVPFPDQDTPAVAPPVGRIDVDKSSLDYNIEEYERLVKAFHQSVTGSDLQVITSQAINRDQVYSVFESKKNVLTGFKKNFEKGMQWAYSIICQLRYGEGFVSCSIDLGNDWFLFTEDELLNIYSDAKAAGHDAITLDYLQDQYFQTKFKNNPRELERTRIIQAVDPFRHLKNNEVRELYQYGLVIKDDYFMKVNLSSLIMEFERLNGDIVQFGTKIGTDLQRVTPPFAEKINLIKETLKTYIKTPEMAIENNN